MKNKKELPVCGVVRITGSLLNDKSLRDFLIKQVKNNLTERVFVLIDEENFKFDKDKEYDINIMIDEKEKINNKLKP